MCIFSLFYAIPNYVIINEIKDWVCFTTCKKLSECLLFVLEWGKEFCKLNLFVGFALECGFAFFPHRSFLRVDRLSHRHFWTTHYFNFPHKIILHLQLPRNKSMQLKNIYLKKELVTKVNYRYLYTYTYLKR